MNGRTAKRLRKATLGELARKHLRKSWPIPKGQEEFDHQWNQLYKGLKRIWKAASRPKSLSPQHGPRTPRHVGATLRIGHVTPSVSSSSTLTNSVPSNVSLGS